MEFETKWEKGEPITKAAEIAKVEETISNLKKGIALYEQYLMKVKACKHDKDIDACVDWFEAEEERLNLNE